MRKTLITILIILILGGVGYFVYTKGLINLDFLNGKTNSILKEDSSDVKTLLPEKKNQAVYENLTFTFPSDWEVTRRAQEGTFKIMVNGIETSFFIGPCEEGFTYCLGSSVRLSTPDQNEKVAVYYGASTETSPSFGLNVKGMESFIISFNIPEDSDATTLKKFNDLYESFNKTLLNVEVGEKRKIIRGSIEGDFNGDGQKEFAYISGNPNESLYEVQFSNKNIPLIPIGNYRATLIYQGDLNNDKIDDIGVKINTGGFYHEMTFFSFMKNKWQEIFPTSYIFYNETVLINSNDFNVQIKQIDKENTSLLIYHNLNKVFEDKDIFVGFNPDFFDFNKDGYDDVNLILSATNGNCVGSSDPISYYLFDPVKNTFHKVDASFASWITEPLKSNSNYYVERNYHPCLGVDEYHLFKLENYKAIYKGYIDIGYDRSEDVDGRHFDAKGKQVVNIYKGKNLIETLFVESGLYSTKIEYENDMPEYEFNVDKYFNENYKKFE